MPAVIQQFHLEDLGSWLPFENWFSLKEEPVSTSPVYTLLKDDHYSNGTNQSRSGYAGVVLHVQKQADKSSVTVKQDNGAVVTYGNLNEVSVAVDDRILKEAVLGTADSYVTINALKNNEKIKVSDAFISCGIRISLLWLPYLLMLPYLPVARLIGWIFIMLTIHEMAHMLCAILFHYPIERINIYPFGLAATITHIGHGSLVKEILIISAGPLMHVLFPSLFQFCVAKGILSPSFASYLHTINASILLFNLLPIYPLDGGRLVQTFFHCFLRFRTAEYATLICSLISITAVFYFHLLQGVSAVIVLIFLILQIFLSWRSLPLTQLQFFHYRRLHPVAYDPILNESFDLYRGRRNIIKYGRGWIDEKDWLRQRFGNEKNSRRP